MTDRKPHPPPVPQIARGPLEPDEPKHAFSHEDAGAYELSDPKHPRHHEVFSDLADMGDDR